MFRRVSVLVCRSIAITLESGIMMKNMPKISQAGTLCCTEFGCSTASPCRFRYVSCHISRPR